jgi:hypothetical protein
VAQEQSAKTNLDAPYAGGVYPDRVGAPVLPLLCRNSKFNLGDLMEEQRKYAILFAATLLCARKLIETIESDKPNLAKEYFVDKAIREAEFILERIDKRWPAEAA